jgi:DnaJ-domain-containing protein 1
MRWYGKLLGLVAGVLLLRASPVFGAALGLLLGHAYDAGWFRRPEAAPDPYRTLGLDRQASDEQVDRAYRRLMSQYHPDRVAQAAPELRELAERRAREINAAYSRIKSGRRSR